MSDYQPLGMWEKLQAWRNYEALKPGVERLANSFSKMRQQPHSLQSQGDLRAQTAAGLLQLGKTPFQPLVSAFARPSVLKPYKGPLKSLTYPELLTTKESSMSVGDGAAGSDQKPGPADSDLSQYQRKQERKRYVGWERQRRSPLLFRADSELVKKAQQQEVKSLVMLKVAAAKVMLGRGVDPSLITTMLKFSAEKPSLNLISATLAGAAVGGLGGGLHSLSSSADARWPAATLARVMAGIVGGGLTGRVGGRAYNWAVSDKSPEESKEKVKGSRGSVRSHSVSTKESSMLVKRAQRQEVKSLVMLKVAAAQIMLKRGVNPFLIDAVLQSGGEKLAFSRDPLAAVLGGAALGGLGGGMHGFVNPGEDEKGKKRDRVETMLAQGLLGAGIGGTAGGLGSMAFNAASPAVPPQLSGWDKFMDHFNKLPPTSQEKLIDDLRTVVARTVGGGVDLADYVKGKFNLLGKPPAAGAGPQTGLSGAPR